ncbi:MAG: potassium uptake protein TrkH family, partial [Clostridia bacterium]|nr:potassium uptake protein TrkH family [Clostridia bacterium]
MKSKKLYKIDPTQMIVLGFMLIILFGAMLLTLPIASREGIFTDFLSALFTATSATCVTGLVVVDTYLYWSTFGQIVIITLIQIGGLGFMTMATLFSLAVRRNISYKERMVISQSLSFFDM